MSDAIEKSTRKRYVRRRRTRTNNHRNRPWSYHADWTAWDYYQTPFFCDHFSNEDLNYDNENIIKKLTEFGENYESWINNELDLNDLIDIHDQKPAVVIEKPEIDDEQLSIVEKVDACTATTPVPFLDKECQVIDELLSIGNNNNDDGNNNERNVTNQNKSTETRSKLLIDSSCQPMSAPPSPIPTNQSSGKKVKATIPTIKIKPNRSVRKLENNPNDDDDGIDIRRSPSPLKKSNNNNNIGFLSKSTSTSSICMNCTCGHNNNNSTTSSYSSSIKFYTSIALAGLLSFLIAVTQFSPEIQKTYPRPPPL
ncbi:hypothetical protein BLA29_000239 [Euroglyphus maynei]|uniref:Uncharacterized protein n=1 Tax=Euroglyphus maynei TaxID=6958 RepID=A0A1Y3B2Z0_EURMA|nr:hypothetical protein BLA29_000239 [Euroglyphus maynei]